MTITITIVCVVGGVLLLRWLWKKGNEAGRREEEEQGDLG